jgi:anaerobic magnesium-protoporphyrin IX monomethyl ester cyclase
MNKKLKVLLVIPNNARKSGGSSIYEISKDMEALFEPPIGVLYLAGMLREKGYEVQIIDGFAKRIYTEDLIEIIKEKKPDILGLSLYITNVKEALKIAGVVKSELKNTRIVVGGAYPTIYYEELAKDKNLDFVVRGEGEYTLLEIAEAIYKKKLGKKIVGCYYRHKGKLIKGEKREFIKDLDALPYPAWDLIDMAPYYRHKTIYLEVSPVDIVSSSRGCPYNCSFCSANLIWERKYRFRSAKSVCDEIEFMIKKYGSKGINFREDNFTVNKQRVYEFCNEIKRRNLKFVWQCESRVDTLDENIIRAMVSAGCRGLWFGLESGSQQILDKLQKGIKLETVVSTVKLCKKYHLITGGSFMFGLPIETKADIQKTFEFAKSLKLDNVIFGKYIGYPNCPLYDYAKANKFYRLEEDKVLLIETPEFSVEDLENMAKWFRAYFRTKRVRKIFQMRKLNQYPSLIRRGFSVLKTAFFERPPALK